MAKRKKIPTLGMNYGHHIVSATYDSSITSADLDFLKEQGFDKIRVAMASYDTSAALTTALSDVVTQAINKGFIVQWGYCCTEDFTSTTWDTYKTFVTDTFVPLAESLGLDDGDHEILLGNEEELKCDGATIVAATVRSDIRALATAIKGGGYAGKIAYSADSGQVANWISDGKGDLDKICFNQYDKINVLGSNCLKLVNKFGTDGVGISEFGSHGEDYLGSGGGGYVNYNNEYDFYYDTLCRVKKIEESGIKDACFFCYKDGSFGMDTDEFALRLTNGDLRLAFNALVGKVLTRRNKLNNTSSIKLTKDTNCVTVTKKAANDFVAANQYTWIGRYKENGQDASASLVVKESNGVSGYRIIMQSGKLYFQERKGYTVATSSTFLNVPRNKWCDWAVTYDGTAQTVNIYIDGVKQLMPETLALTWANVIDNTSSNNNLSFGVGSASENWNGYICDNAMYARILTRQEISDFSLGIIPTNPQYYFSLNDGSGTSPVDGSGNGNVATCSATLWSTIVPFTSRTSATNRNSASNRTSV